MNQNDKINFQFLHDSDCLIMEIKKFGHFKCFDSLILTNQNDINKYIKLIDNNKITNNMKLVYDQVEMDLII